MSDDDIDFDKRVDEELDEHLEATSGAVPEGEGMQASASEAAELQKLLSKPLYRLSCKTRDPSWHAAVLTLRARRLSLLNGQWQQMTKIQQQHHKRQVKKVQAELKQLVQRRRRAKSTETFNRMQLQQAMSAIIANIPLLQEKGPEQDK